ncbi:TatD family hydrolase [Pelagicoccus sp. SDUM812003]|uniref:TatD family hydrolase n=1 Tax=Pelagicoccus sp. SDUM812003 TaxID=3041267 RepID=UPI00280CD3C8|nr:TatD family hydrolase [Pelagicoccus sp. SDUM812003]MDQ8203317.1 TatD family hydrolase [Pelagicoccus sp. SDUM812003]
MSFYDAHCHLQDERLGPYLEEVQESYQRLSVRRAVVNGTSESDWQAVADLVASVDRARASYGLHPWFVTQASSEWKERLRGRLDDDPSACVGEIGLDRWIKDYDIDAQRDAFHWQLGLAAERERPVTIHCLQAWGMMLESVEECDLPSCGFLLHSYGGSAEMVESFAALGAYFSVSGYFALERKAKQREVWKQVPVDRLLIETDAPDMAGPDEYRKVSLRGEDGEEINHPANIEGVYEFVSKLRAMPMDELKEVVRENFVRLFGEA